jgi:hypothetical protein
MKILKIVTKYFCIIGVLTHVLFLLLIVLSPKTFDKAIEKAKDMYYEVLSNVENADLSHYKMSVDQEIDAVLEKWSPDEVTYPKKEGIWIAAKRYNNLTDAVEDLNDGDELSIGEGRYEDAFLIQKNHITIIGYGHVIFENKAYGKKAFIVNKGQNLTVKNIECRNISVSDKNGACIRQESKDLTLEHVYFHGSENGILESSKTPGSVYIYKSVFEKLGLGGRAHGVYINTADLYIYDSVFIATKKEGHSIKSRGAKTYIKNSIVTSLSSKDSRLIDVPNGGELIVEDSILHQGRNSANGQAIGYGLEGMGRHKKNSILLKGNMILLERLGHNVLLSLEENDTANVIAENVIISQTNMSKYMERNELFESRTAANIADYPYLPMQLCHLLARCLIKKPL